MFGVTVSDNGVVRFSFRKSFAKHSNEPVFTKPFLLFIYLNMLSPRKTPRRLLILKYTTFLIKPKEILFILINQPFGCRYPGRLRILQFIDEVK